MATSKRPLAPHSSASAPVSVAPPPAPARQRTHRILTIAPTSFFADYGCHVRIYEETRALQQLGHQVTICTYHTGRNIPGLDIRRAMNTPGQHTVRVGSNFHKLYYDGLLSLKALQVALQVRPTVIHAHLHEGALIGYPISRLLRVPLVFDFQGSLTSEMLDHKFIARNSPIFSPLRRLEVSIDRIADVIITSSRNAAEMLARDLGRPSHQVITLPDAVDTDVFLPAADFAEPARLAQLRKELALPADRVLVVYLGLLAEYQGTGKLLEAASILVARGLPVHFLIMGFPGEDAYRAQAAQLGLAEHTTFTGRIPYQDAPAYLALGDIAVSPKMSETEGNGKLLDYMAAGLPTVTFDTPVAKELLGEHGIYARLGDSTDLARALELLVQDEGLRAVRAGELRRRAVEQFSWLAAGKQLLSIYDTMVEARR